MATHYSSSITTVIRDNDTGDILSNVTEAVMKTVKREEIYYMIIFHAYGRVLMEGLPRSCDYILDMIIVDCIPWKDGDIRSLCVFVGEDTYEEWARKSYGKYSPTTLKKYFYKMIKKDVFRRTRRGTYMINPYFMFKGNLNDINKARERWNNLTPTGKKE